MGSSKKFKSEYIFDIAMIVLLAICAGMSVYDAIHSGISYYSDFWLAEFLTYFVFNLLAVRILSRATESIESFSKKYVIVILTLIILTAAVFFAGNALQFIRLRSLWDEYENLTFINILISDIRHPTAFECWNYGLFFLLGLTAYMQLDDKLHQKAKPVLEKLIFEEPPKKKYVKEVDEDGRKKLMEMLENTDQIKVYEQCDGESTFYFFSMPKEGENIAD